MEPFSKTKFGQLAPETRELIFSHLLASPPPYGGRDFRAGQGSTPGQLPISLDTFVDLKASCLTILHTCRQIYREAFPLFYANKSYYLANAQDLVTMLNEGERLWLKPSLFRLDTITSLCITNFVVKRPLWSPKTIDHLVSTYASNREELQAERIDDLDLKLNSVNLAEMKNLKKICICMRVGQEKEYLKFLFNVRGLERGVIHFADNYHWVIRSQSQSAGDWKLQYAPFSLVFWRKGRNLESLSFEDIEIQKEVLDIDSRASDLVEGDERWVEIDIGERDYENRNLWMQQYRYTLGPARSQEPETQQEIQGDDAVIPLTDDQSDQVFDHLQGSVHGEDYAMQVQDGLDQRSEDLHTQQDGNNNDTIADNEPDREFSYPQNVAEIDDHSPQTEPDHAVQDSEESRSIDHDTTLVEASPTPESEHDQGKLDIKDRNDLMALDPKKEMDGSPKSAGDENTFGQAGANSAHVSATALERVNSQNAEDQHEKEIQGQAIDSSILRYQVHLDAQYQTDIVNAAIRNVETQTDQESSPEQRQSNKYIMAISPQEVSVQDKDASYQPKVRDRQQLPVQPKVNTAKKLEASTALQMRNISAMTLRSKVYTSLMLRQWTRKRLRYRQARLLGRRRVSVVVADENPITKPKHPVASNPQPKPYSHVCFQVAVLTPSLSLLYAIMSGRLEGTLTQLVALFLSILLFFLAHVPESQVVILMLSLSLLYAIMLGKVEGTLAQLVALFLSILLFFLAHVPESA